LQWTLGRALIAAMSTQPDPPVFGAYDQAQLDAQYNNRGLVPDHLRYIARWPAASERARAVLGGQIDLTYGSGPRDKLDLFRPRDDRRAPLLIFIHGGYWQMLDKSQLSFLARPWVRAGAAVAMLGYPLCPQVTMDGLVASVRAGIAWLAREAGALNLDARRFVVSGHSAGGHLTAMAMTGPGPELAGGVALSGLYDLEPIRLSYVNGALGMSAEEARRNSPIHLPRPRAMTGAGKLILAVGSAESEEYHRQIDTLSAAWDVEARSLAGLHHFSIVDALNDPGAPLFGATASLLGL
jgi:arylformamidase